MKIVFLSPASQGGGAEEVLVDLVAGLKAAQPDWILHVICGEPGPLIERLRNLNIPAEVMTFPSAFLTYGEQSSSTDAHGNRLRRASRTLLTAFHFALYSLRLKRRLRELNPNIVHSNGMKMHLVSAFAANRKMALVWHMHDYLGMRRFTSRLLPRLSSRVRLVLANSRSVARDVQALLPGTKVEVLENSVDLARFQPNGERLDLDRLSGLPAAPSQFLKVGLMATFARWKGHDIFIRAIELLPSDLPVRFYVIGGPVYATAGSQWTKDELLHAASPVAGRMGFTGWVENAASALRSLDIVIHASTKPEPFGLVIIQAMACGKAVIVSGEGGAAEVVDGQPDAMTFTPRDPQSLADAILFLVRHPERRASAAVSGPDTVRARFGRERMSVLAACYLQEIVPNGA